VRLKTVAIVVLLVLAAPAVAGAHIRSGTVAVDYRATVEADGDPAHRPFASLIDASDQAITLVVRTGHSVVVLGYLGEAVLRVDTRGIAVNAASPSAADDGLLSRVSRVTSNHVEWRLVSAHRTIVWHDARLRGMPPGVSRRTWSVPLVVDGKRSRMHGELVREPAPAHWPWLAFALSVVPALVLGRRRRHAGAVALGVLAGGASVVTSAAFALDVYASPGTWILGLDALAFVAAGLGVLVRGPRDWHAAAALSLGLTAVAVGLAKGDVFLHPIVLSVLPAFATRLVVTMSIVAGASATALGAADVSVRGRVGPAR